VTAPRTLPEALASMSRGWAVYTEGLEQDNDDHLLSLGATRINEAIGVALDLIKKEI
jgi:hypothetical protein